MRLFIPSIGARIRLLQAVTVPLLHEARNSIFLDAMGVAVEVWRLPSKTSNVTLPKDMILSFDRFYIRKGKSEFDSITFRVVSSPDARMKKGRFWLRLSDVNQLDVELVKENTDATSEA